MIKRGGCRLRHEFKFHISPQEYTILRSRLKAVMKRDKYAGPDGRYHIRSLYFDDFRNTALFEKLAGIKHRKKYRIRIYNLSDKVIKLECKAKLDQYISKRSVKLTRDEVERILSGDVGFLARSEEPLKREIYLENRRNLLRPKVIVDYHREAFVCQYGNVRITFDIDLRSGLASTSMFDPDVLTVKVDEEPGVILEVKYDNYLPSSIQSLFLSTIQPRSAIGKYVICRKHSKLNSWEDQ